MVLKLHRYGLQDSFFPPFFLNIARSLLVVPLQFKQNIITRLTEQPVWGKKPSGLRKPQRAMRGWSHRGLSPEEHL